MSTAGLIGSDVYLPTLPTIGQFFGKTPSAMQFTLAIYLLGLALGQLLLGPLTDRYGRKILLLIGMLLYFSASIGCAFSGSYEQMLTWRFVQALGAASGLVIGRAIVGDLFDIKEAGKVFSSIFPFVGMSPAISPVIGGYLGFYLGWQSTFIFVALFAIVTMLLAFFFVPETLTEGKKQRLHLLKIFSSYPKLFCQKKFIAYASTPCIAYIAYFGYIAESPFIFHNYGYSEKAIGTFYISLSITYVAGNLLGKKLLNFLSLDKSLLLGYGIFNLGGVFLILSSLFHAKLVFMIIGVSIITFGNGFLIPQGTAGVISTFSKTAGYASGLLGFLQLGAASLSSSFVNRLSEGSISKLAVYLFCTTLIGAAIFLFFNREKKPYAQMV
jgi:DHA1 family bicyclomycin/chloramphenicol resistance-like MFS transporter